ncbi:helicase-associated domain-containing protein [Clostridium tagluense]|uniref:helicase-associated domain-containing protein n=1 Tax=Clostridium tagluense TaxID=360422 RepID=UPI001C0BCEEB|nr:helicase-associated domain-containing protein [Clostridium tagluense]MBU3129312.1 helicase-associated domain-containing protein [Clostridium tagluense]
MNIIIRNQIEQLTIYNLTDYLKISDIRPLPKRKADMVDAIEKIITDEIQILKIWKNLSDLDKELMEAFIRGEGSLDTREIDSIYEKHHANSQQGSRNRNYRRHILSENSKANLFFINGSIPSNVFKLLKAQLKEIEIKFEAAQINIENYVDDEKNKYISIGEDFEKDFLSIIKLINSSNLKVTDSLGLPNKTALVKMNEALKNKEISRMDEIKSIEKSTRLYGIFYLLMSGKIVQVENKSLILTEDTEDFLELNMVGKCKYLLDIYLNCEVDELARINEMKLMSEETERLERCRKTILNYIKKAPIDEWIDMKQLAGLIKKTNRNFLVKAVGAITKYDDYHRYYYDIDSWEVSERFLDVVFIEYLSTIGIVDLIVKTRNNDYDISYIAVKYFKLTALGAHVLGVNSEYKNNIVLQDAGMIIQPNFEIMVPLGSKKESYCLNLDRFAEKKCEDLMNIYELNFRSMIRALDSDISIEWIIEFLLENSKNNIPGNVLTTLEKWKQDSSKIKIRTVTIVETEDKYLLEELRSYKGVNKYIENQLPHAFEIDERHANKVKREIEKKAHFCILSE